MWLLNRLMIWGAVLGFVIGCCVVNLIGVANHHGHGILFYGGGGDQEGLHPDSPEFEEKVSEWEYKRESFLRTGLILLLASTGWYEVAKAAKNGDTVAIK